MANFVPIKTIESKVSTIPVGEGKFIFCTDTGNIYIDAAYGSTAVVRRQGFPKHIRPPVELILEAGSQSGLDMIGDVNDPILNNTIVFVKEVESYFYFDAESTEAPNGETVIKPEYVTSGAGRWKGFTTHGITPHIDEVTGNWFRGTEDTGKPSRGASPTIVDSFWYIDGINTNTKAEGKDGKDGEDGSIITMVNNYWYIDGVNTNVKALGVDGVTPSIDPNTKHWMIGSIDTGILAIGQNGINGLDGTVVTIDPSSKHWLLNGTDSGIKAEGIDGIGLNFRGIFNPAASPIYSKTGTISDTVVYEGGMWAYIGVSPSNNTPPTLPELSNNYWVAIPVSSSGGGGSEFYFDTIESLTYSPGISNAMSIFIDGQDTLNGIYVLEDPTSTGNNRVWMYYISDTSRSKLAYNSYYNKWIFSTEYGEGGDWFGGYDEVSIKSTNYTEDPWLADWILDDMGPHEPTPITVSFIKLSDKAESHGLASFGSFDKPIPHGAQCHVLSEKAIYVYDVACAVVETPGVIIRPEYIINPSSPGRWIKSILTPEEPNDYINTKKFVVSTTKYHNANVYLRYMNSLNNEGTDVVKVIMLNDQDPGYYPGKFTMAANFAHWIYSSRDKLTTTTSTVEFWAKIKYTYKDEYRILHMRANENEGSSKVEVYIDLNTNNIRVYCSGNYSVNHPVPFYYDEWFHIAVTQSDKSTQVYINGVGLPEPIVSTGAHMAFERILVGTTRLKNNDRQLYSELIIHKDKCLYDDDFYPDLNPLSNRYYPLPIPQYVDNDVYERYENDYLALENFVNIGKDELKENKTYIVNPFGGSTITPKFTPGKIASSILIIYNRNNNLTLNSELFLNTLEGIYPPQYQITAYEIKSVGSVPQKYIISKIASYAPKYGPSKGSTYDHRGHNIINPYTVDINRFSYDNKVQLYNPKVLDNSYFHPAHMTTVLGWHNVAIVNNKLHYGNTSNYLYDIYFLNHGTYFNQGWQQIFLSRRIYGSNTKRYIFGIHNNRLVEIGNTNKIIEDDHHWSMFKMTTSPLGDFEGFESVSGNTYFGITTEGALYYRNVISYLDTDNWEHVSTDTGMVLIDDTKKWKSLTSTTDFIINSGYNPMVIGDGELYMIDADFSLIKVDEDSVDYIVDFTGYSLSLIYNGWYSQESSNLWKCENENGTYYILYLTDSQNTSLNNRWVISTHPDPASLETSAEVSSVVKAQTTTNLETPVGNVNWSIDNGSWSYRCIITLANKSWHAVSGTMKNYKDGFTGVLAVSNIGTCRHICWNSEGELISDPVTIDGVVDVGNDWKCRHDWITNYDSDYPPVIVSGNIFKGTTLYSVSRTGITSSASWQHVVAFVPGFGTRTDYMIFDREALE